MIPTGTSLAPPDESAGVIALDNVESLSGTGLYDN
jgi:hypothetical protein